MNHPIIELSPDPSLQPAPSSDYLVPWLQKRTRNGKIARLPRAERDLVNHMLSTISP